MSANSSPAAAALLVAILRLSENPALEAAVSEAGEWMLAALFPETVSDIEASAYRKLLSGT